MEIAFEIITERPNFTTAISMLDRRGRILKIDGRNQSTILLLPRLNYSLGGILGIFGMLNGRFCIFKMIDYTFTARMRCWKESRSR